MASLTKPILYVEDELYDRMFLERALRNAGLDADQELKMVGNGREAVDYLSGQGGFADRKCYPIPDLVLLDLHLPQLSGFEVLKWIRAQPGFLDLPVIIFTSSSRKEDQAMARDLGADDFWVKPTSFGKYTEVVERLLAQKKSRSPGRSG